MNIENSEQKTAAEVSATKRVLEGPAGVDAGEGVVVRHSGQGLTPTSEPTILEPTLSRCLGCSSLFERRAPRSTGLAEDDDFCDRCVGYDDGHINGYEAGHRDGLRKGRKLGQPLEKVVTVKAIRN